jgi:hypothetical protein
MPRMFLSSRPSGDTDGWSREKQGKPNSIFKNVDSKMVIERWPSLFSSKFPDTYFPYNLFQT